MSRAAQVIFGISGLGLLCLSASLFYEAHVFAARAAHAHGSVVRMAMVEGDDSVGYAPVVGFTAADHHAYQFTSKISSSPPAYANGDEVEVLYDPADPLEAGIDSFVQRDLGGLITGGIGLVFVLFTVVPLLIFRRRLPSSDALPEALASLDRDQG